MRIELSEEAMYKRMDRKDKALILVPISGGVLFVGIMLLAVEVPFYVWGGLILVGVMGMLWNLFTYFGMKRLIMPTNGCFLEVEGASFSFAQPCRDGVYEKGRIYLEEVESLIDDGKNNGFYLRICKGGKSRVEDGRSQDRRIVYIAPFGYKPVQMDNIYKCIYDRLPESAGVYERER